MAQHEARATVLSELNARPFLPLNLPLRIYHFAFMTTDEEALADRIYIAELAISRTSRRRLPTPSITA